MKMSSDYHRVYYGEILRVLADDSLFILVIEECKKSTPTEK